MTARPALAASDYLNAAPVVYAFAEGSQRTRCTLVSDAAPSRCAMMLENNQVDGALIPAIEYQRIPGLAVARGVCIGARRSVRSVLLVSRTPLARIESVALDTSSRTSAALVRIILERFHGLTPRYSAAPPDLPSMLEGRDAALLIGDPAMTADTRGFEVYDLAEVWREHTGLPFVFALWAVQPERVGAAALDFPAAMREGRRAAPLLAGRFAGRLGIERESLLEYLTANIHYELDDESLEGLALYYRLAAEQGLTPPPRPLRFWPRETS